MTKEELLSKGVSENVADEIIAAFEDNGQENSLSLLEKALNKKEDTDESLFKAADKEEGDKGEEEDDDDYDEKYMKKYMKRYMKENEKEFEGEMKKSSASMKKAREDFDMDAEGAVVEMADLKPFLDNQMSMNDTMCKAISNLQAELKVISAQNEESYSIMTKAARVQVEQAKALDSVFSQPVGRKGLIAQVPETKMQKAVEFAAADNAQVYSVLMKATRAGDTTAGLLISAFESAGKNVNSLNPVQKKYISELLIKEAN